MPFRSHHIPHFFRPMQVELQWGNIMRVGLSVQMQRDRVESCRSNAKKSFNSQILISLYRGAPVRPRNQPNWPPWTPPPVLVLTPFFWIQTEVYCDLNQESEGDGCRKWSEKALFVWWTKDIFSPNFFAMFACLFFCTSGSMRNGADLHCKYLKRLLIHHSHQTLQVILLISRRRGGFVIPLLRYFRR